MRKLLFLFLPLLLVACSKGDAAKKPGGPPAVSISVTKVARAELVDSARAYGEVEAGNAPEVAAEVAGRVLEIVVKEGQRVAAGAPLARLEAADLADASRAASAEVTRLAALRDQAASQLKRDQSLERQGFISAAALDKSRADLAALDAQLKAARATASARERDVGRAWVRAPLAGIVEQKLANVGDFVPAGKALFLVAGDGASRVRFALSGAAGERLAAGQTVKIDGRDGAGKVVALASGLDVASRARVAYAEFPGLRLRVGETLNVVVELGRHAALAVPTGALVERPQGRVVYVIDRDVAREVKVETGLAADGRVEVLSGLKAGDVVAVDGAGFLADKAKVRLAEPGAKAGGGA
ncbi:efflux RND transporter periplasmic adaptor subunit [Crenobacter cavernae]|uniref:Efflux RND transporter periplasmic adaptor subunit n=1 Tax=Crenobacter cavernae TaxID=2290923 RepID=A0ABY0FE05_9NEIS|nr:efflux RND transporter periplasmic adaptor subunit [Crenobacter cavernae]RXZ44470.1 efflux RND transporter periplasmic adaptor subunit [Crenobacter cavernae]